MYSTSLAYIALIKNKNNPNHTINMKFNGGRLVDHPIRTDIDVGAVAPWMSIIPTQPHNSGIFFIIVYPFVSVSNQYTIIITHPTEYTSKKW